MPEPSLRKLSKLQAGILIDLLVWYRRVPKTPGWRAWGTPFRWLRPRGWGYARADSAAFARALARLERRGLVSRKNDVHDSSRANHVRFTDLGLAAAEELARRQWPDAPDGAMIGAHVAFLGGETFLWFARDEGK